MSYQSIPSQPIAYSQGTSYQQTVLYPDVNVAYYDSRQAQSEENAAKILFVIGFFSCGFIIWVTISSTYIVLVVVVVNNEYQSIVYFMYKNSLSDGARQWAKISGILVILHLLVFALSFGAGIILTILFVVQELSGKD